MLNDQGSNSPSSVLHHFCWCSIGFKNVISSSVVSKGSYIMLGKHGGEWPKGHALDQPVILICSMKVLKRASPCSGLVICRTPFHTFPFHWTHEVKKNNRILGGNLIQVNNCWRNLCVVICTAHTAIPCMLHWMILGVPWEGRGHE